MRQRIVDSEKFAQHAHCIHNTAFDKECVPCNGDIARSEAYSTLSRLVETFSTQVDTLENDLSNKANEPQQS